ncbi:MAG: 16S rRNA (uracil(1498)-N(3))-methyltransferase [Verrucomicrobia bacterium]|nr:16S rRNA (uracil(1498)-N(3))-methyltransferase [Verrucomicrobiota bacterium]
MNLILFEPAETAAPLPRRDPRATHIIEVLRRGTSDSFDCGLVNGPRGKATVEAIGPEAIALSFSWGAAPPPPEPITLIVGLPRPQTARDILRDATALGVGTMHFVRTEKTEPSYAQSTLWSSSEWRRHLLDGAQQAFDTRLPAVTHGRALNETLAALDPGVTRVALDHYEATVPLHVCHCPNDTSVALAIGPERGWSARDREVLRAHGFTLAHLGPRVLRVETAVIAALTLVRSQLGLLG